MILVAIGANLPDAAGRTALGTCRWAASALDALPGLRVQGLSRWYASRPVPEADQPDYVNGVAHLVGQSMPLALLKALHRIEERAGRVRGAPNAARTLDLDLIAHLDLVLTGPELVLPHPRAHLRPFVLAPLHDVAPGWRHPTLGASAAELLAAARSDSLRVIGG